MKINGRFLGISVDYHTGDTIISFATTEKPSLVESQMLKIKDKPLEIKALPKAINRSLDANKLLWHCLGELSKVRKEDNWALYLEMLRKYGEFTYICVKPSAVESVKRQWRETQEVGTVNINGEESVQLLCFFGSSTYDTKQFSRLLDGVLDEMSKENIPLPTPKELQIALERWEQYQNKKCIADK